MALRHGSIAEAYSLLGVSQGASLDEVKTAYKQLALRIHPDKNPDNPEATLHFQQVGDAYRLLVQHISTSPHHNESDIEVYYDSDDLYEYYDEDSEQEDDLISFFEELLNNHAGDPMGARFRTPRQDPGDAETKEQYAARIRRQREEQAAAAERRKAQEAAWKARRQMERENEARAATDRRKKKAEKKKAETDAARIAAAQKIREQQYKVQRLRSEVFEAARQGEAEKVRKGVWEDGVDAAGGEVAPGAEEWVEKKPSDERETLLHIATARGDEELVEWLDRHNAEADERNGDGLTAFHLALQHGHVAIVQYFLRVYSPTEADSVSVLHTPQLLRISLASGEPEIVWLVLEAGLVEPKAVRDACRWYKGTGEKGEDIKELLRGWQELTLQPTPTSVDLGEKKTEAKKSGAVQMPTPPETPKMSPPPAAKRGRGRGRGKGRGGGRGRSGEFARA